MDLLGDMRSELALEGWMLGDIDQTNDSQRGYTVRIGSDEYAMCRAGEGKRAWELTTARTAALISESLAKAGSAERVHALSGGEDCVFVLLTPALHDAIASSGVFPESEIPSPT